MSDSSDIFVTGRRRKEDPKPNNIKPAKKGTTLTISSKRLNVKVKGVTYKVTAISDKAFKGINKKATITVKDTKKQRQL